MLCFPHLYSILQPSVRDLLGTTFFCRDDKETVNGMKSTPLTPFVGYGTYSGLKLEERSANVKAY